MCQRLVSKWNGNTATLLLSLVARALLYTLKRYIDAIEYKKKFDQCFLSVSILSHYDFSSHEILITLEYCYTQLG